MKFICLLPLMILTFVFNISAQSLSQTKDTSKIYVRVDTAPQFPGGNVAFEDYIDKGSAKLLKPQHEWGIVVAEVLMEKNGHITYRRITRSSLSPELDSAAVYLLKNSPLWKPAFNDGQPVRALVRIGVKFKSLNPLQPVHVKQVVLTPGHFSDVTTDEPVGTNNAVGTDPNKIFTSVEKAPAFPGGIVKFYQYLKDNRKITVPADAIGDRVIVQFIVEKDGSLTDIKVVRSVSADCDAEAIRLMRSSPRWAPGIAGGVPVRVKYNVPVLFKAGS